MTIIHKKIITFVVLLGLFSAYQIGLSNASDYDSIVKTFLGDSQLDYHYNKKLTITNDMDKELTLSANFSDNLPAYSYIGSGKLISPDGQMNILPGESKTFTLYLDPSISERKDIDNDPDIIITTWYQSIHTPLISLHLSQTKEFGYQKSCWIETTWHHMANTGVLGSGAFNTLYMKHGNNPNPTIDIGNQYAYLKYTGKALRETQNQYVMSSPDSKKLAPQVKNEDVTLTIERCDDAGKNTLTIQNNSLNESMRNLITSDRKNGGDSIFENGFIFNPISIFEKLPTLGALTNYTLYLKQNGEKDNFFAKGDLPHEDRFSFSFSDANNNFHMVNLKFPGERGMPLFFIDNKYFNWSVFYDDGSILLSRNQPNNFIKWSDIGIPNTYSQQFSGITALQLYPDKLYFFLNNGTYFRYDMKIKRIDPGYPKDTATDWGMSKDEAKMIAGVTLGLQDDADAPSFLLKDGTLLYGDIEGNKIIKKIVPYSYNSLTLLQSFLAQIGARTEDIIGFGNPLSTTKPYTLIETRNGGSVIYDRCHFDHIIPLPANCHIYPQHTNRMFGPYPGLINKNLVCEDTTQNPWGCEITNSKDAQGVKHMTLSLAPSQSQALANWPMLYRHFE